MEHDVLMGQDHPLLPDWVQEMEDWDFQLSADEEDSDEDSDEDLEDDSDEDESDESSSGETTEESDGNEQEMD